MRALALFFGLTFLLAPGGGAAEPERVNFRTVDGRVFEKVTVKRVAGRTLEVMTDAGPQLLRFTDLPLDIQVRYFEPSMLHPPQVDDVLDFKTRDGRAFNGKLTAITPNGISIETADGVEKVPYAKLPPELANTFDYDPADAARYEAEQQRAFAARQAAELAAQRSAQKASVKKSSAKSRSSSSKTPAPAALGESGREALGVPRLGGSGLGK